MNGSDDPNEKGWRSAIELTGFPERIACRLAGGLAKGKGA
jgi:hypothetical protein